MKEKLNSDKSFDKEYMFWLYYCIHSLVLYNIIHVTMMRQNKKLAIYNLELLWIQNQCDNPKVLLIELNNVAYLKRLFRAK